MIRLKNKIIIKYILILILFSICSFIFIKNKYPYFGISYIFTLTSISGVFVSKIVLLNDKKPTKNFPFVPIAIKYLIIEILIVMTFMIISANYDFIISWRMYLFIHSIVLISTSLVIMYMLINRKKVMLFNEKTEINIVTIKMLLLNLESIKYEADKLPKSIKEQVSEIICDLYEKVRFCDPMTNEKLKNIDNEIAVNISKLQSEIEWCVELEHDNIDNIKNIGNKIKYLIDERNRRLLILK